MSAEPNTVPWEHDGLPNLDEEQLWQGFRQMERDSLFFEAHRAEWTRQYPEKYVAVYQEELICVADTGEELINSLVSKKIPLEGTYCKFLSSQPMIVAPVNRMLTMSAE